MGIFLTTSGLRESYVEKALFSKIFCCLGSVDFNKVEIWHPQRLAVGDIYSTYIRKLKSDNTLTLLQALTFFCLPPTKAIGAHRKLLLAHLLPNDISLLWVLSTQTASIFLVVYFRMWFLVTVVSGCTL